MKYVALTDQDIRDDLFPFSSIRHVADIRIGILTIREKWEKLLNQPVSLISESNSASPESLLVNANIIPSTGIIPSILLNEQNYNYTVSEHCRVIQYPWHIVRFNDWALREDFKMLTSKRVSETIP